MASPTGWTWVWVSSGSWWWTRKPGMLQSMGSQRVRHDWVTELNIVSLERERRSFNKFQRLYFLLLINLRLSSVFIQFYLSTYLPIHASNSFSRHWPQFVFLLLSAIKDPKIRNRYLPSLHIKATGETELPGLNWMLWELGTVEIKRKEQSLARYKWDLSKLLQARCFTHHTNSLCNPREMVLIILT